MNIDNNISNIGETMYKIGKTSDFLTQVTLEMQTNRALMLYGKNYAKNNQKLIQYSEEEIKKRIITLKNISETLKEHTKQLDKDILELQNIFLKEQK